jgi:hypothetical protein
MVWYDPWSVTKDDPAGLYVDIAGNYRCPARLNEPKQQVRVADDTHESSVQRADTGAVLPGTGVYTRRCSRR